MLTPIIQGILLGLALAFMFGPALFALLQTSIHRGFKSGVLFAFGIFLSDLLVVLLIYFGISKLIYNSENSFVFGIIGGIILVAYGVISFSRKGYIKSDSKEIKIKMPAPITFVLKGFFLNFTNPGVWLMWMVWMATISAEYKEDSNSIVVFFVATLLTVVSTDTLKCFIAGKIKQYLKAKTMTIINRIVGILLVLFGIYIILSVSFGIQS